MFYYGVLVLERNLWYLNKLVKSVELGENIVIMVIRFEIYKVGFNIGFCFGNEYMKEIR